GLDLAGVVTRPTGICVLRGSFVRVLTVYGDDEIIGVVLGERPDVVAIDAPLSLPRGKTLDSKYCVRVCDMELMKMGIKFFPLNFKWMRNLTMRGIKLRKILLDMGFNVIETYPGGAQDILGLPRVKRDKDGLRFGLKEMFNLEGEIDSESLTPHEIDSVTCAIVGKLYLENKYIAVGDPDEMIMILPKPRKLI
ncbi:MAG: DUF429 domain-containing protein, partial [Candidatus Methanomethylicia archaeon]